MADLFIKFEWEGDDLVKSLGLAWKNMDWVQAKTLTACGQYAKETVTRKTPQYVKNPTTWTMRSIFLDKARPNNLEVKVGFKDYAVKGTPASDYLQPIAAGVRREAKPHEIAFRARGIIPGRAFLVPTGNSPYSLNQYGNVSAGKYTQLLSRFRSLRESGSNGNATNSPRSRRSRRETSLFVQGRTIQARTARNTTRPVFYITNKQPSYNQSFPARKLMTDAATKVLAREFKKQVEAELNYKRGRGR